jgi:site-specific DNA recombinase
MRDLSADRLGGTNWSSKVVVNTPLGKPAREPGVTAFNQKPNKPPQLPSWWIGLELKSDGIRVSIKLPIAGAEKSQPQLPDQVAIARSFPMQLKRRGVELRLIVGDHHRSGAIVDLALLKAVARAHRWFDELSTGKARSLAEIAAREGLAVRYVGRLIRLAFLAPDIVESIVEGRQPTGLTAEAVTRHIELPLEWRSQRTALNIQ